MQKAIMNTNPTVAQTIADFIKDSWPAIIGVVSAWKGIDAVKEYFSKRQETRLRELIKAEVNPQMDTLILSINDLRETVGALRETIRTIQKTSHHG